jgi:1-acylglycerone phosphate reductase
MSETLRLELAPLGVRVVTLMAGNVKSNISANAPPPTSLPDTSPYKPVEKYIAADEEWSELPADKFAKEVVSEVLNGASGKMWKGGNSGIVRWLVPFMPQFVFVSMIVHFPRSGCAYMVTG